jgi:hypothetical protein
MKKDIVELVGVIVKINGKEVVVKREKCSFYGWAYEGDCNCWGDNGVDLTLNIDKKEYKLEV